MKIHPSIKRAALIAIALVLEAIDKHITEALEQPLEAPKQPKPSKCTCSSNKPLRPEQGNNDSLPYRPFITATTLTSKYTPEQIRAMYKDNPYTNKPYNL